MNIIKVTEKLGMIFLIIILFIFIIGSFLHSINTPPDSTLIKLGEKKIENINFSFYYDNYLDQVRVYKNNYPWGIKFYKKYKREDFSDYEKLIIKNGRAVFIPAYDYFIIDSICFRLENDLKKQNRIINKLKI